MFEGKVSRSFLAYHVCVWVCKLALMEADRNGSSFAGIGQLMFLSLAPGCTNLQQLTEFKVLWLQKTVISGL